MFRRLIILGSIVSRDIHVLIIGCGKAKSPCKDIAHILLQLTLTTFAWKQNRLLLNRLLLVADCRTTLKSK
jgi:hypothetical protein